MIKINSNFMMEKDHQNWILTETKMGISRSAKNKGEEIKVTTQTYHPNTEMVARAIIDRLGDADCDSLKELIEVYKESISLLSEHVSFICTSNSAEDVKASKTASETNAATTNR